MIISRGLGLFRQTSTVVKHTSKLNPTQIRNASAGVVYRDTANPSRVERVCAELVGGVMWWWVFWNMWHNFGHIVGEYPYPDPSSWTDEELGIPPDDVD